MEHIAALLLIIGCSDAMDRCEELPAPVPVFETVEECEATLRPSIDSLRHERRHVIAKCVTVDPALEEEDAELVWDINPDGTLFAEIGSPDIMVASNASSREKDYVSQE